MTSEQLPRNMEQAEMKNILLIAVCFSGLSGCIKLQMPDDLVSDTVEAGMDVYKEVKKPDDDATAENLFSHSIVGVPETPVADLKKDCLNELETRTVELLDRTKSDFTLVSEHLSISDETAIASCTVSLSSL